MPEALYGLYRGTIYYWTGLNISSTIRSCFPCTYFYVALYSLVGFPLRAVRGGRGVKVRAGGRGGIFSTSRPSPLQCTGYVVLDEHVGPAHQLLHYGFAVGVPEVHAHAPLVPVQRREVQAQAVGGAVGTAKVRERRPVAAAVVAGDRPLDLDHVRAHVGQDHRAVRARGHPGHVDHAYAVQRSRTTATRAAQIPVESYRRCGRRSEEEEERAADEHDDGCWNDPPPACTAATKVRTSCRSRHVQRTSNLRESIALSTYVDPRRSPP